MKIIKKCLNCNGKNFRQILEDKGFELKECKKCGLMSTNPQLSWKELDKYYSSDYYSLSKIKTEKESPRLSLKLKMYDFIFNKKILDYMKYFLVRWTKIVPSGKILDVGCGSGQFLYEMKKLGMKTHGVEPGTFDKETSEKEGLNVINKTLCDARYPSGFFDVITMNHVLEHVPNPKNELKEVFRILKRGGTLIIGTPNINSKEFKLLKEKWFNLDFPRHLFHFSDRCLVNMLKKMGFVIKEMGYHGSIINLFPLRGLDKYPFRYLSRLFYPIINKMRNGGAVQIVCQKI